MGGGRATIWDGNIAAVFSSHFCICLTQATFVFVFIPLLYLFDKTKRLFVFAEHICNCLFMPHFYLSSYPTLVVVSV